MADPVLVTGGAGYVGGVTARWLAAAGRTVVVLDDLSAGHEDVVRWGEFVRGDIANQDLVASTIRRHRIRGVLHFAAKALVGESMEQPDLYDRWNRGKTQSLAAVCAAEGIRAFVFSSTCAVYGNPREVPIPETHPREPVNPYGRSKADAEDALFASGVATACLRYFNAAGAEPDHGLGERHDPETHLIPLAIRAAASGEALAVFGTDWPTPDGTCVRDYVHVADLAVAHLAALDRLERGLPGGAWNLGTGRGASVREVVAEVGRAMGKPVPTRDAPRRAGDPPALVARPDAARRDLGWAPRRSDLATLVRDAVAFARGGGAASWR